MDPATNPFAVLTFIAAPAILTNASSVMGLSTSNRLARSIDRSRVLAASLEGKAPGDPRFAHRFRELAAAERRMLLLVRALTCFYVSLGGFAAASLISLIGAALLIGGTFWFSWAAFTTGLLCGVIGLGGLVAGSAVLVRESGLVLATLREQIEHMRRSRLTEPPL